MCCTQPGPTRQVLVTEAPSEQLIVCKTWMHTNENTTQKALGWRGIQYSMMATKREGKKSTQGQTAMRTCFFRVALTTSLCSANALKVATPLASKNSAGVEPGAICSKSILGVVNKDKDLNSDALAPGSHG